MKYIIVTDSCCDLPLKYVLDNNLTVLPLSVTIDKEDLKDDLGKTIDYKEFYKKIREGKMPITAQVNAYAYQECFRELLRSYNKIIYIGFSSALSGCVNSARMAKSEIEEEYQEEKIAIIDSLSASMGLGLLVYYAKELQNKGYSYEELVSWLEANKLKINHWFTVEDLHHLERGGRVSKMAATFGTVLNIKPLMYVNDEGKLIPISKVKGRKKSLKELADKVKNNIKDEDVIFISHGDSIDDAKFLMEKLKEETKVKEIVINNIGAAIGSHAGPGTIAVFFKGDKR